MTTRVVGLAIFVLAFIGYGECRAEPIRHAENTVIAEQLADADGDQQAGREMDVGRWNMSQRNYIGSLNRFKVVVTRFQTSRHFEEAVAHLVEVYIALGYPCEAQNMAATLGHKFPDGRWITTARNALKAAGLEPATDETRCPND